MLSRYNIYIDIYDGKNNGYYKSLYYIVIFNTISYYLDARDSRVVHLVKFFKNKVCKILNEKDKDVLVIFNFKIRFNTKLTNQIKKWRSTK